MAEYKALKIYLKQIHHIPTLTEKERKKYFLKIKKKGKDSEKARLKIIQDNLSLVVNLAKKYYHPGMQIEFLDFIEEGNIGLIKAVEKYDSSKGFQFSTYASWWIEKHFQKAFFKSKNIIQLPERTQIHLKKIENITRQLLYQTGRSPDIKELSKKINLSIAEIRKVLHTAMKIKNVIPLDYFLDNEQTIRLEDMISTDEISVEEINRKKMVKKLMSHLTDKEKIILNYRFALDNTERLPFDKIAKKLKLTMKNVYDIYESAIKKLKRIAKIEFGEAYLHFNE